MLELAVDFSMQRSRFGRLTAALQAVQRLAADLATPIALALAASDNAVIRAIETIDCPD
jgi:alkylation response protein AidB-like acyl-CoA dehydrogenase